MKPISLPMAELKPALMGIGKVIDKNSTLPVLASVKVERTREGWITLTGSDLQRFVTVRMEQPTDGEPISVVLPYQELLKTANKCASQDVVSINSNEPGSITLQYPVGKQFAEHRCESIPVQDFPETPRVKGEPVPVNDQLRQVIHEAMECASIDSTRLILNGVFIDVTDPKCNQVVATDGRHLFASNSFSLALNESIILPEHKFLEWKGFNSDGEWQIRVSTEAKKDEKPLVQLSSRRWRFITNQHDGNYPNYRQVIPTEFKTTVQLPGEVLATAVEIVERIPYDFKSVNKPISLKVDGRKLIVRGQNKDDAQFTEIEVVGAKITGDPVTISLNRDFALKALKFGLSQIEIIDEMSPLKFSKDGKQVIVMPVRASAETSTSVPTSASESPTPTPPPQAEKPEIKSMPETTTNGATRSTEPPSPAEKPALDTALAQVDVIKGEFRNAIAGLTKLGELLKQVSREQKVSEKEIQGVRQTIRSLQGVRI